MKTLSQFHRIIILWADAKVITEGAVGQAEACRVFKIDIRNMQPIFKKWVEVSGIAHYNTSEKLYLPKEFNCKSKFFDSYDDASLFLRCTNLMFFHYTKKLDSIDKPA